MRNLFIALLLIFAETIFAGEYMQIDSKGRPLLFQFSEDGFVDCVFRIEQLAQTAQSYKFHMSAFQNDEVVGFNVEVVKDIQGGFDADMNLIKEHVYDKGVVFSRSGIESDRFLDQIATFYGLPAQKRTMVHAEAYTAIALQQGDINMDEDSIKIKIFGRDQESDDPDTDYNESFFNLDLKNGFVYWNEKDQDYRASLVNSLSQ